MSRQQTQPGATTTTATKPAKELTFGSRVGRGITKLQAINDAEAAELAASPDEIKARHAKKRESLLAEMDPAVRGAVLAAATASAPKAAAEQKPLT